VDCVRFEQSPECVCLSVAWDAIVAWASSRPGTKHIPKISIIYWRHLICACSTKHIPKISISYWRHL